MEIHKRFPLEFFKYVNEVIKHRFQIAVGCGVVAGIQLLGWIYTSNRSKNQLYKKIEEKQEERKKNFSLLLEQVEGEEISEKEERILEMTLEQVLLEMKNRNTKCTEVLRAYQKKAYQITQKLNCVVEFLLEAQEMAESLDNHPDPASLPLFGIPFCLKLNYAVKDRHTSLGYVRDFFKQEATDDAVVVKALKRLGAIPFCITNLSQTIINARTKNPIFGETLHPLQQTRTCGGSSGGDGALVGAGGALAGFGSDMAGSVRIPAAFCGNVSFKPTGNRFSRQGVEEAIKGHVGLEDSPGFQCRDVAAIVEIYKALYHPLSRISMQQEDVRLPPLDFNSSLFLSEEKLCIGYSYGWDRILPATPAAKRAVDEAVKILERRGHKLVRYDYPDPHNIANLIGRIFGPDGLEQIRKRLREDIVEEHVVQQFHHISTPSCVKRFLGWIGRLTNIRCLLPYYTMRDISVEKLWDLQYERLQYIQQVKSSWDKMCIEAVIAPAYPCPALKLEHAGKHHATSLLLCQYTAIYNLLDFPAGVVPLTRVHEEDITAMNSYPTHDFLLRQILQSAPGSEGLPMAAQIAAPRWKDEIVLRLMQEVEEGANL